MTLEERIEATRELLQEAGWPQIWAPSLGYVDPNKARGTLAKNKGRGVPTKQKLHPEDEPREKTFQFPLKGLNYRHEPYMEPGEGSP